VSGAISPDEVKQILSSVGFQKIAIERKEKSVQIIQSWNIGQGVENIVFSAYVSGEKPLRQKTFQS
jgi:hypothetical protein